MMWWTGSGYWWIGALMMFVFWGGLIWAISLLAGGSGPGPSTGNRASTPADILAERFARGEISKNEFEERRSVLARND